MGRFPHEVVIIRTPECSELPVQPFVCASFLTYSVCISQDGHNPAAIRVTLSESALQDDVDGCIRLEDGPNCKTSKSLPKGTGVDLGQGFTEHCDGCQNKETLPECIHFTVTLSHSPKEP